MLTISTIHCFDMLDKVHVQAVVSQRDRPESPWEAVLSAPATFTSEGVTEPHEWLRDCLVALLETL